MIRLASPPAQYTANLAAFFNKPAYTLSGPSTLDGLKHARTCTPFGMGVPQMIMPFAPNVTRPPDSYAATASTTELIDWCYARLQSGEVEMIVYDRPVLMDYLHNNPSGVGGTKCATLHDAAWLSIIPDVWLLAMRAADAEFGMQMAMALADVKNTKAYVDEQVEFFHLSKECGDGAANDTDPIGLESMGGRERSFRKLNCC